MIMSYCFMFFSSMASLVLYPPLSFLFWLLYQSLPSDSTFGTSSYRLCKAFILLSFEAIALYASSYSSGGRYWGPFSSLTWPLCANLKTKSLSFLYFIYFLVSSTSSKISRSSFWTFSINFNLSLTALSRNFILDCSLSYGSILIFSSSVKVTPLWFWCFVFLLFPSLSLSRSLFVN